MKRYIWILATFLGFIGCEDLEDTYSDYAGDGVIRYVGQCTNVTLSPGWERLIVKWTNNVDPTIEKVKVKWALDDVECDTLLDKNTTEFSIDDLSDGNYEVSVTSVDKDGNESLSTPLLGRPYTLEHEDIRSFTRLISKHYFIKDRLVLFFTDWYVNMESAKLFYMSQGVLDSLELTETLLTESPYYLLQDVIDTDSDVILKRTGRLEGCEDLITFAPDTLTHDRMYTADFRLLARSKYGQEEITDAWANEVYEIEYDFSVNTFEDIMNLPNLQEVILGKNRHLRQDEVDKTAFAELQNVDVSLFALQVMHELCGVEVKRYGNHYFSDETKPDFVIDVAPFPPTPDVNFLNPSNWEITSSWEDTEPYDSHVDYLIDGDETSDWLPEFISSYARTYELTIDMQTLQTVNGIQVVQNRFDATDAQSQALMPSVISVEVSSDNINWESATYVEESTLGLSNGEATYIDFKKPMQVRYLRFRLYDQLYGQNFSVSLAEIRAY